MSRMARRMAVFLVGAVLVSLVAVVVFDVWARRRADAEFARLEKKYGSLDGRSIVAPRVPDDDNSARFVRAAADLTLQPGSNPGNKALFAIVTRFEELPASSPVPEDVRAFLDANREAMRLAGESVTRHQASWDADYAGNANQPRLLGIRFLSTALYLAGLVEINAGQFDAASQRSAAGLSVAASLRNEPSLISQLIRLSVAMQQCQAVKKLIAQSEPSTGALEQLARLFEENRQSEPLRVGLIGELRWNAGLMTTRMPDTGLRAWIGRLLFGGEFRRRYVLQMERLIDAQSGPRPRSHVPPAAFSTHWSANTASGMIAGLGRAMDSGDTYDNVMSVAEIGVALRRYRLDRGTYPGELSALVPAYLARLPVDAMTGKPPVYARVGAGFTLKAEPVAKDSPRNAALEIRAER